MSDSEIMSSTGRERHVELMNLVAIAHVDAAHDVNLVRCETPPRARSLYARSRNSLKIIVDPRRLHRQKQMFRLAILIDDIGTDQTRWRHAQRR